MPLPRGMSGAKGRARLRGQAGRDFGRACVRLEQENHQQMSQDPSLGDFRVLARRSLQAKNAFQALERHLDTPAGTVKITDFGAGPSFGFERCDENDPFGGGERAAEDGVAFSLRSAARLGWRYFGGSGGFTEGNGANVYRERQALTTAANVYRERQALTTAQRQGRRFLAPDPSRGRLRLRRWRERPAGRMACLSHRAIVLLSSRPAR